MSDLPVSPDTVLRIRARRLDRAGNEDARAELRIEDDWPVTVGRDEGCLLPTKVTDPFRTGGPGREVVFDVASGVRRLRPCAVTDGFVSHSFFGERIDVRGSASPIHLARPPMLGALVVGPWRIQFVLAPRMAPCVRCRSTERRRAFCLGCGRDLDEPPPDVR